VSPADRKICHRWTERSNKDRRRNGLDPPRSLLLCCVAGAQGFREWGLHVTGTGGAWESSRQRPPVRGVAGGGGRGKKKSASTRKQRRAIPSIPQGPHGEWTRKIERRVNPGLALASRHAAAWPGCRMAAATLARQPVITIAVVNLRGFPSLVWWVAWAPVLCLVKRPKCVEAYSTARAFHLPTAEFPLSLLSKCWWFFPLG
jgi:hypothetical protein